MNRRLTIFCALSFSQCMLAMDLPKEAANREAQSSASVQDIYLKIYEGDFALELSNIDLEEMADLYGAEKTLTAYFITLFAFIKTTHHYTQECSDFFGKETKYLSPIPKPANIHINYAFQIISHIINNWFNIKEIERAIDASCNIFKINAEYYLSNERKKFHYQYQNSTIHWNDIFYHFESRLLKHCTSHFLTLFYLSMKMVRQLLPADLKKSPFDTAEKLQYFCETIGRLKDVEKKDYYLKPWINHLKKFNFKRINPTIYYNVQTAERQLVQKRFV